MVSLVYLQSLSMQSQVYYLILTNAHQLANPARFVANQRVLLNKHTKALSIL